jgi:hypothetical protein
MNLQLLDVDWNEITPQARRNKLMELECAIKDQDTEVTIEPVIYSAAGVYAREITIPAGTALVGEIHLKDQINVVSKGVIKVATEEGVRVIEAPCTFVSPAGTKRAGFAMEDTVWTTFLATDKTEDKDVYSEFIAPDYDALDKTLEHK